MGTFLYWFHLQTFCVNLGPLRGRSQDGIAYVRDRLGGMPLSVKGAGASEGGKSLQLTMQI